MHSVIYRCSTTLSLKVWRTQIHYICQFCCLRALQAIVLYIYIDKTLLSLDAIVFCHKQTFLEDYEWVKRKRLDG